MQQQMWYIPNFLTYLELHQPRHKKNLKNLTQIFQSIMCLGGGIFTLGLFLMLRNGPSHEGVVVGLGNLSTSLLNIN